MSDRMSSVSRSSRISAKSQIIIKAQGKVIAEEGGQISEMAKEMQAMKQMMIAAGISCVTVLYTHAKVGYSQILTKSEPSVTYYNKQDFQLSML